MSRPREKWWGYVKACIREYPVMKEEWETARRETDACGDTGDVRDTNPPRPTEWAALERAERRPFHGQREREFEGVRAALTETESLKDGSDRLQIIETVFWRRTHTLAGAAALCHVSERTARRWHGDFIRLAAFHMKLTD